MENAPCHKIINELLGDLEIKYQTTYSPFLNPIDECFSVFKSNLRHQLNGISAGNPDDADAARQAGQPYYQRRLQPLHAAINAVIEAAVARDDVAATYHQSNSFLMACLLQQDIWHE